MSSTPLMFRRVTCAAVQTAPAFLDRDATIGIIAQRVAEASAAGAELVTFGEAFLPGFPTWVLVLPPTEQHDLTVALYDQAVEVPGSATDDLAAIARDNEVVLSVGLTERSRRSVGTMWNSNLLFDADGTLTNHRRKLVPTWAEKLVWSNGDGHGLRPAETSVGRVGVLICGENTNPLARFAMIDRGEQIHLAPYPPAWPTRRAHHSTNYDLTHAIHLRSAAHSFEGKVTTVAASALMSADEKEAISQLDPAAARDLEAAPPPVSAVIDPTGRVVGDALVGGDGIVARTVDLAGSVEQKQIHDVSGGYQRFDVFTFRVNETRRDGAGATVPPDPAI